MPLYPIRFRIAAAFISTAVCAAAQYTAPAALGAACVVYQAGCAGKAARNDALLPAVLLAADGVEADTAKGIALLDDAAKPAAFAASDALFAAVRSKDRLGIAANLANWAIVRARAESGITSQLSSREIGPSAAQLMRKRLDNFESALTELAKGAE